MCWFMVLSASYKIPVFGSDLGGRNVLPWGLIGVAIALILFCKRFEKSFLEVGIFTAPLCPIGLGLGRLANFVNAELPGRQLRVSRVWLLWVVRDLNQCALVNGKALHAILPLCAKHARKV